ncbi:hypothetical protein DYB37_003639 [Aphanomyces astaci]|uniref:GDP-mannose 4,6-dehydratase n=1 Tax=Aphanomyces astaci TaxID=112090 RepID=A0A3R7AWE9_APHAT|nr:hypothetical protein DYB35_002215 [Aphanomyces astaci]RHZ19790.1 hypothetical protein DYB37_003639 [Aphanomyces astaci]
MGLLGASQQERTPKPARQRLPSGYALDATKEYECLDRVALITGITGQDGSYLSELLLSKGYIVHGIIRRSSSFNTGRINHLYKDPHLNGVRLFLHYGDLSDSSNLCSIVSTVQPHEVYNLGAMSHVKVSFEMPEYTADIDGLGTLRLLNAIRTCGRPDTSVPQNEDTPFHPRSPYGVAKQYAFWTVVNYREAYGMYCVNGILFNHESPRRGPTFVTRKVFVPSFVTFDIYWGHARDFVRGMWQMLQLETAEDFVLATGECHSVREFIEVAFAAVGLPVRWEGGPMGSVNEVGVVGSDQRVVIRVDPKYFRPAEVDLLLGDASKAKRVLPWEPSTTFEALVAEMIQSDMHDIAQRSNHVAATQ